MFVKEAYNMPSFHQHIAARIAEMKEQSLFKYEHPLKTTQTAEIDVAYGDKGSKHLINLCANNYLGLADHPQLVAAAKQALDECGFGLASVRFICGTHTLHKQLEAAMANFLETQDCILFPSCFDANGGVFEVLLDGEDAVISDALNHASIIDGIRLCKAQRYVYANNDMHELEVALQRAQTSRFRLIVTDGVFSMDGIIADLPRLCALAQRYDAMVMVDDSHATGFVGRQGKGTPEHFDVMSQVAIYSGTFGKALGGGSGGYICASRDIVTLLRQKARPYLFSNALAPMMAAATLRALALVQGEGEAEGEGLRQRLYARTVFMRQALLDCGFNIGGDEHPIIAVLLGSAESAVRLADYLLERGIYVKAFSYPVVPRGKARIRLQMSAALDASHLHKAVAAFADGKRSLGL